MNKLDYERVFSTLVKETRDYVINNHLQCMVLGISGGIDSTVVAAICHEVSKNTGVPLIGRSLPIKNKEDEFNASKLVGKAFCNDFKVCNLSTIYETTNNQISKLELDNNPRFTLPSTAISNGNIQARLRMTYLYNLASIYKGLVMSTDNQTEYQLGFWTIHGDVGDFNPIQDLWKTEIYELAHWIRDYYIMMSDGEDSDQMWALKASIALTPTDGLGISNSDLEQIGAKSYDEVDDILRTLCDYYHRLNKVDYEDSTFLYMKSLLESNYGVGVVNQIWNRHLASEFKRKKAPIYITRNKYK